MKLSKRDQNPKNKENPCTVEPKKSQFQWSQLSSFETQAVLANLPNVVICQNSVKIKSHLNIKIKF